MKITGEYLARIGGWRAAREGRALFEAGRVLSVSYEAPLLSGVVQLAGGGSVEARLRLAEREVDLENLCRCRQAREDGIICAHVLALGYAIAAGEPGGKRDERAGEKAVEAQPVERPALPFEWRAEEDALAGAQSLRLRVVLAPGAVERVDGVLQAMLEGAEEGSGGELAWRPLERVVGAAAAERAVDESDELLLRFVEGGSGAGLAGSMLTVPAARRGAFFAALAGHPRVWLGRDRAVRIASGLVRGRLSIGVEGDGRVVLQAEDAPLPSGRVLAQDWYLGEDDVVRGRAALPPAYAASGRTVLEREDAARFFAGELPALCELAEIEPPDVLDRFRFRTASPQMTLDLDGTMNALQARLFADYPGLRIRLDGSRTVGNVGEALHPDPSDPAGYWRRDERIENAARSRLLEAGFLPGKRDETVFVLAGEGSTAEFLADRLPGIRADWYVRIADRLATVMERMVVLRPRVVFRVEDGGGGDDWLSGELGFEAADASGSVELTGLDGGLDGFAREMLQGGRRTRRLGDGRIAIAPVQAVKELEAAFGDLDTRQARPGVYRLNAVGADFLARTAQDWGAVVRDESGCARLRDAMPVAIPAWFRADLRPYQREGVEWMARLEANGLAGILADEMGLGKTVQTLAWIGAMKEREAMDGPALVVCPTSLVSNWLSEAEHFAPALKCVRYEGANRARLRESFASADLVVASYAILRVDAGPLCACAWGLIALDEGQQIKNPESRTAKAAAALQSPRRLVLTGTPVENSVRDVWSLFHFLMPGYLGRLTDFRERYEGGGGEGGIERLRRRVRPLILRRLKETVAPQLPALIEETAWVDLTAEQRTIYSGLLDAARRQIFEHSGRGGEGKRRMTILAALLRLRQASCHLGLLPSEEERRWKAPSAKFDAVWDRLEEVLEGGHRVLVYSQFTRLLGLLRKELDHRGIAYCYLDGATQNRGDVVRKFQAGNGIPAFLISLKAGGSGLNLAGADTVFLLDPWWNPAAEAQAIARAHRIGQERRVVACRFLAKDTVEERVARLQERKREVAQQLLEEGGDGAGGGFELDELEDLLR